MRLPQPTSRSNRQPILIILTSFHTWVFIRNRGVEGLHRFSMGHPLEGACSGPSSWGGGVSEQSRDLHLGLATEGDAG